MTAVSPMARTDFLGVAFDRIPIERLLEVLAERRADHPLRSVITPNVDHVVRLDRQRDPDGAIGRAYHNAGWTLCDSRILALLARIAGLSLPVVPGSDLTASLLETVAAPDDRIAVVGGDGAMIAALAQRYPALKFSHHEPPMSLARNPAARTAAAAFVAADGARFTLIAVGSPQQELIASEASAIAGATGTALCIGASLDFIVGRRRRAPRLMRRLALEWLFRLASEPRRLAHRYVVVGPRIVPIMIRWLAAREAHKGRRQ